jgi:hypothetical protein
MRFSPLMLAILATPAFADTAPAATPAPSIYRFEISITGMDPDPKAAPATYTLTLQEGRAGTIATGANIALSTGQSAARQNVGLDIKMEYTLRGGTVILDGDVELTALEPNSSTIHRVRASDTVPINGTTLFASVYDVVSHRRYEVNVSAKKLL